MGFHQVLLHYLTLFVVCGGSPSVDLKVWTFRLLDGWPRRPRYFWLVLVEVGVSAEGLYYVQFEQLGCEMVWPQSLSLSLWRVGVLVFCSSWGDSLILHDAVVV